MHDLDSSYVRDQLRLRTVPLTGGARRTGDFVLYWMQSTHRLEENWALRLATLEADARGLPLLVYQGLDPTYPHASDRIHIFVMQGAREIAARAATMGYAYRFALRRRRDDDRRVVDRIAARAALVVTDLFPTAGVAERSARFASRCEVPVVAVESSAIVPSGTFPKQEYAAHTIRPKLHRLLEESLELVTDRPPRRAPKEALLRDLDVEWLDLETADVAAEVARCEIDHEVRASPHVGGLRAARDRLTTLTERTLDRYHELRREPASEGGRSMLSPYLHFGQISAAEIARAVLARRSEGMASFLDELLVWRELALNFCLRNPRHTQLRALPAWAVASMTAHRDDEREHIYTLAQLERAGTHDELWNAAQRELLREGTMHNAVRQLWGKSVVTWTRRHGDALRHLIHLNDRWALDGRDPNSYLNILWCFGMFDRPFPERPVWGMIRPMSLERARKKFDAAAYVSRWSAPAA